MLCNYSKSIYVIETMKTNHSFFKRKVFQKTIPKTFSFLSYLCVQVFKVVVPENTD